MRFVTTAARFHRSPEGHRRIFIKSMLRRRKRDCLFLRIEVIVRVHGKVTSNSIKAERRRGITVTFALLRRRRSHIRWSLRVGSIANPLT